MQGLEWISSHSKEAERYSGKWIALTKNGIVAFGDSTSKVEAALKKKGISLGEVTIVKVPRKDEELSILKAFASKSKLTEKDALELGRKVNKGLAKRYRELM